MQNITKPELDVLLDQIAQDMKIDDIKTRDELISYLVRLYGDQWRYKKYHPIMVYILWFLYITFLISLIYIAINGGITSDKLLRTSFHSLWIMTSNCTYLLIVIMYLFYWYTISRKERFDISITIWSFFYFITFPIGLLYQVYHYFRYRSLPFKAGLIIILKLSLAIFIIPFTWWIGTTLSYFIIR